VTALALGLLIGLYGALCYVAGFYGSPYMNGYYQGRADERKKLLGFITGKGES
jgi:hypothetical protein